MSDTIRSAFEARAASQSFGCRSCSWKPGMSITRTFGSGEHTCELIAQGVSHRRRLEARALHLFCRTSNPGAHPRVPNESLECVGQLLGIRRRDGKAVHPVLDVLRQPT